jgi:hypothetical protein
MQNKTMEKARLRQLLTPAHIYTKFFFSDFATNTKASTTVASDYL